MINILSTKLLKKSLFSVHTDVEMVFCPVFMFSFKYGGVI